jgi:5-methylcytosine-specific restriction endonuclease McrA
MSCESCGVTFHGRRRRFCSERCFRNPIDDNAPAFTPIDVGACLKCGCAYVHRADTIAAGYCSALHNKQAKRSARKRLARAGTSEPYTLREIAERDGWCCHLCGGRVPDRGYAARDRDATIDHLIPVSAGGHDIRSNVALAHNRCNWERGNQGLAQLRLVG